MGSLTIALGAGVVDRGQVGVANIAATVPARVAGAERGAAGSRPKAWPRKKEPRRP